MNLLISFLTALGLTLVFELVFALIWGVRKEGLLLVILMNVMTNPAVNLLHFFAVSLLGWPPLWVVPLLELAVVIVEGICCRGIIRRPWLFVLLANGFSYTMGVIIQKIC